MLELRSVIQKLNGGPFRIAQGLTSSGHLSSAGIGCGHSVTTRGQLAVFYALTNALIVLE
jgi:hypothetical protein